MRKLIALALVLVAMLTLWAGPVGAANPTVTITVNAATVSITNTQATWNITALVGAVNVDDVVYFSADGNQDDNYSQIENTGNVAVDVEIQGQDFNGGAYNWTLAAATGAEQYSLYANNESNGSNYVVEVKSSSYDDITTDLAVSGTYDWSMKFTAPSSFDASDDGSAKTSTLTLVASEHT